MKDIYNIHTELTTKSVNQNPSINQEVFEFAKLLGWNPSYFLPADNYSESFSNGYLSVEHGLENTAVLAFLNKPYNELNANEIKKLDSVAYNNLVPWLIPIDKYSYYHIYILSTNKRIVEENRIYPDNFENLRSEKFLQIIGKKPNPNIPALDDSLITTISYWKRYISNEIRDLNNEILSSLFNSIIFVRAIEDNNKRFKQESIHAKILISAFDELKGTSGCSISMIIQKALKDLSQIDLDSYIIDFQKLKHFDALDKFTVQRLLYQFYETEDNKFSYDFSIMTKHALSRVYEKYVTILNYKETDQLSFFNPVPYEINSNKTSGTYYTPEYIARFFAKFILRNIPTSKLINLEICEPAVGSGMFLRTLLEVLFESVHPNFKQIDKNIFDNLTGIDIDPNACNATKLSLSLLHLLIYNELPAELNIINSESITYLSNNNSLFDVVISNPPFVRYENSKSNIAKEFIGSLSSGKTDQYLAFLKLSIEILEPNGIGLFVLPHSFLINNSAYNMRRFLSENTQILLIADLSAIQVFGNVSTYVILLIFQKKGHNAPLLQQPLKIRCKNMVGKALEDALNNIEISNENYTIYRGLYSDFDKDEWLILPPSEYLIERKFAFFPHLSKFMNVRQGFITGADDVFIRNKYEISGEEGIYLQYIPDKELLAYSLPTNINNYVFYPYINNRKAKVEEIQKHFPRTWAHLVKSKKKLQSRSTRNSDDFWLPTSPRLPEHILKPKIFLPELSVMPKFSLDLVGNVAISHSCYLTLKEEYEDVDLFFYFLGVLNSTPCYWYISNHSNKYGSGYNKIQPKTLKRTPIPDPFEINKSDLIKIIKLVKERIYGKKERFIKIERELDLIVCNLYRLTSDEVDLLLGQ